MALIIFITKKIKNIRWLLFFGVLFCGMSLWMMGPSLEIPNHVIFPFLGEILFMAGYSLINIPLIPDMIVTLKF